MPRKASTSDGYPLELAVSARKMCLYVATILGDLLDDIVVVGGLVPYLVIDQAHVAEGHVGTRDLDLGLSIAVLHGERYRDIQSHSPVGVSFSVCFPHLGHRAGRLPDHRTRRTRCSSSHRGSSADEITSATSAIDISVSRANWDSTSSRSSAGERNVYAVSSLSQVAQKNTSLCTSDQMDSPPEPTQRSSAPRPQLSHRTEHIIPTAPSSSTWSCLANLA